MDLRKMAPKPNKFCVIILADEICKRVIKTTTVKELKTLPGFGEIFKLFC